MGEQAPPPPEVVPYGDALWGDCSPAFRAKVEALLWAVRDTDAWEALTAEMVNAYPHSPLALCIVGHAHRMRGALPTAREHLARAAELALQCPHNALALAEVLLAMGDADMAVEVCDRAMSLIDHTDPALHLPALGIARVLASTTPEHRVSARLTQLDWLRSQVLSAATEVVPPLLPPDSLVEEFKVLLAATEVVPPLLPPDSLVEEFTVTSRSQGTWENVPVVIDRIVISFLRSPYDRAQMQCVSRRWREAATLPTLTTCQTPLLIHPFFSISDPFRDGLMTSGRHILFHRTARGGQYHGNLVGSCGNWVICLEPEKSYIRSRRYTSAYLMNPLSGFVEVKLPDLCELPPLSDSVAWSMMAVTDPEIDVKWCTQRPKANSGSNMKISKAVLSAAPEEDLRFITMGLAYTGKVHHFALCNAGSPDWFFLTGNFMEQNCDIAYFNGKLYLLNTHGSLIALDVSTDQSSSIAPKLTNVTNHNLQLHPLWTGSCNHVDSLVSSTSGLLLVRRSYDSEGNIVVKVEVWRIEFQENKSMLTQVEDLEGHSLFISERSSFSIKPGRPNIDENCIYFLDLDCSGLLSLDPEGGYFYRGIKFNLTDGSLSRYDLWADNHELPPPIWILDSQ